MIFFDTARIVCRAGSVQLSGCLSVRPSVCMSVCPSVRPSIRLSVCLSVCLSRCNRGGLALVQFVVGKRAAKQGPSMVLTSKCGQ